MKSGPQGPVLGQGCPRTSAILNRSCYIGIARSIGTVVGQAGGNHLSPEGWSGRLNQQFCNGLRVAIDYGQIGAGGSVGEFATQFPIPQGSDGNAIGRGKGRLGQSQAFAELFYVGKVVAGECVLTAPTCLRDKFWGLGNHLRAASTAFAVRFAHLFRRKPSLRFLDLVDLSKLCELSASARSMRWCEVYAVSATPQLDQRQCLTSLRTCGNCCNELRT